jgi:hypothetical protein
MVDGLYSQAVRRQGLVVACKKPFVLMSNPKSKLGGKRRMVTCHCRGDGAAFLNAYQYWGVAPLDK